MRFQIYESAENFYEKAIPFLKENEDKFSLFLGVLERIRVGGYENPLMATIEEDGELIALFQMTPPHPLNIIFVDPNKIEASTDLGIEEIIQRGIHIDSIISVKDWAMHFAEKWEEKTGQPHSLLMDQGLYRLDQVDDTLEASPGSWRLANDKDAPLIESWLSQFEGDTGLPRSAKEDIAQRVEAMLNAREVFLWEDEGEIVSMMKKARPSAHGVTVSMVFTPKEKRRKGYARTMVAACSKELLKEYDFCVLYTDMLNPTSNKIYQEIGYQKLLDSVHLQLGETK
ncbi:GNAT family N-acetyltransferase [Psychrobacillus sp. MER TA 171]|uniref:GNAT family N-acetyltransferase n=1 Tax=Psychrobacillus sp. MER TA 171 TaxID=2939577 RepID=UPI002040C689|nr:GNAT family N-acetyltransferase [Psychrobacillus sp. MER TA 171]MCM3357503.1 GNAT family N-acetyltransferase [Psychrobacillus sp. MER TA 171]